MCKNVQSSPQFFLLINYTGSKGSILITILNTAGDTISSLECKH